MGQIKIYPPVKFFAAVTFATEEVLDEIKESLQELFSETDNRTAIFPFSKFTPYYEMEMGVDLHKQIITFRELHPAENLVDFKIATNHLEAKFLKDGRRQINIDPGYLCAAKMILATTKDYDHRIYLSRGIFGDVHYRYRQGAFQINDWTYPDYKQPFIMDFFQTVRKAYLKQLRDWNSLD